MLNHPAPTPTTTWLDRDALAEHINVRVEHIRRLLKQGRLPVPSYHLGPKSPRWCRDQVDAMMRGDSDVIVPYGGRIRVTDHAQAMNDFEAIAAKHSRRGKALARHPQAAR